MVILESFLAMFILTLANGIILPAEGPVNIGGLFAGVGLFIGFFALLAAVVIPRTAAIFERIKSEELFVLFALGTVFLAAALAEAFRIPAIVGAFFMGMVFADTDIASRLKVKMESLRDAFVAIFFLSFAMLFDPGSFSSVLPMLLIAGPLILLNDLFLPAALAYFIGFSGRASTAIGTSMIARNEEAILYATVGASAIEANPHLSSDYAAKYLTPFAGILCIVMSSLQPILMGRSDRIAAFLAKRLPKSITFGAELVKRTLKTVIMPNFLPIYRRKRVFQGALIAYSAWIIDLTITTGPAHLAMSVLTPILVFGVWASARHAFQEPVRHTNYGVDGGPLSRSAIETFVLRIVVGALAIVSLVAILWQYYWPVTLPILYAYFLVVVFSMKVVYRRLGLGVGRRTAPSSAWMEKQTLPSVSPGVWRVPKTRSPTLISDPSFNRRSGFTGGGGAGRNQRVSLAFFSRRGASSSKIAILAPVAFRMDSSSAVGSGWPWVFRTYAILAPRFSARPSRSSPAKAGSTTAACMLFSSITR